MFSNILAGLKNFAEEPPEDVSTREEEMKERIRRDNVELKKWGRKPAAREKAADEKPTGKSGEGAGAKEGVEKRDDSDALNDDVISGKRPPGNERKSLTAQPDKSSSKAVAVISLEKCQPNAESEEERNDLTDVKDTASNHTMTEESPGSETWTCKDISTEIPPPDEKRNLAPEQKGFLARLSTATSPSTETKSENLQAQQGFFQKKFSGISNQINCIIPSSAQGQSEEDYKDVILKVHVRLHRKQDKINVQLNVKVDPEATEHWLEPGEVSEPFSDAESNLDSTLESTSDGYHTQTTTSSEAYCTHSANSKSLVPLGEKDQQLEEYFESMIRQKYFYDCTKTKLYDAIKLKILKLRSSTVKFYNFTEICQILRNYLISSKIEIVSAGELIFFEKASKTLKHNKMDSVNSLSLSSLPKGSKPKKVSPKDKKACAELMSLYMGLQHAYRDYRTLYFDAAEEYGVQVVESRFGYFMCDMKEELLVGNMVLCGQVSPFYSDRVRMKRGD